MTEPAPDDIVIELTVGVPAVVGKALLWPGFSQAGIDTGKAPAIPGMAILQYSRYEGTPTEPGLWMIPVNKGYGSAPPFSAWIKVVAAGPPPVLRVRAPLGMRLEDTVDIVSGDVVLMTLDAHVGQATSGLAVDGNDVLVINDLRAIVAPWEELDYISHRVIWRGDVYMIDGPPMVRRLHGRDHHWTLRLTTKTA